MNVPPQGTSPLIDFSEGAGDILSHPEKGFSGFRIIKTCLPLPTPPDNLLPIFNARTRRFASLLITSKRWVGSFRLVYGLVLFFLSRMSNAILYFFETVPPQSKRLADNFPSILGVFTPPSFWHVLRNY